jgi:hypothetical protein
VGRQGLPDEADEQRRADSQGSRVTIPIEVPQRWLPSYLLDSVRYSEAPDTVSHGPKKGIDGERTHSRTRKLIIIWETKVCPSPPFRHVLTQIS